jgi:MFS superfamily sulfate permease-like transporter
VVWLRQTPGPHASAESLFSAAAVDRLHDGPRTRLSRVPHGVWLLLFAALLPAALGLIPVAALAGVLIHVGVKLIPLRGVVALWREHRGEALVLVVTAVSIVAFDMFEGVLIGLGLAVIKTAWEASHVKLEIIDKGAGSVQAHHVPAARLPRRAGELGGQAQRRLGQRAGDRSPRPWRPSEASPPPAASPAGGGHCQRCRASWGACRTM